MKSKQVSPVRRHGVANNGMSRLSFDPSPSIRWGFFFFACWRDAAQWSVPVCYFPPMSIDDLNPLVGFLETRFRRCIHFKPRSPLKGGGGLQMIRNLCL